MQKPVYLRCFDIEHNHYKYYKMTPTENDTFLAEWGREGANPQSKIYPMSKWDSTYNSKIRKGYEDKTRHFALEATSSPDVGRVGKDGTLYAEIPDKVVRELVSQLMSMSKEVVQTNYNISAERVTQKMIDEAQAYIDGMVGLYKNFTSGAVRGDYDVWLYAKQFNNTLAQLMNTVPRKVTRLQDVLLNPDDYSLASKDKLGTATAQMIHFEEDLLNNMRTCVAANVIEKKNKKESKSKAQTILEALELEITPCTQEEMKQIMGVFTPDDKREGLPAMVAAAYRVVNKRTEKAFEEFKQEYKDEYKRFPCKLLWHGSRNENWWSIIYQGLKIRPSNAVYTGSMFGDGIYFANKAKKSYGYTSSVRAYWTRGTSRTVFMALYNVAVGNQLETQTNRGFYSMNFRELRSKTDSSHRPYHSVYAKAGPQLRNDELIMYDNRQTTIKYLVMFDESKRP